MLQKVQELIRILWTTCYLKVHRTPISSKYRNPGPYTPYNISIQCNIKMFATNNRRSTRDNNDGLRIVDDHSRPLHFVPDLAFVQEEHGRRVYASDLIEVYAVGRVCA
jgi:hypothetical protein